MRLAPLHITGGEMPRITLANDVSPVNPRWAVERAVREARMPMPAKCVMMVLLSHLPNGSLCLGEFSPGTRRLADETGADRHTVILHLALLAEHGWLSARVRKGCRPQYTLSAGEGFTDRGGVKKRTSGGAENATSSGVKKRTTYRPATNQETDLREDQDHLSGEETDGTGRRPAHTSEDPCEVVRFFTPPHPLDVEALLAGIDLT